MSRERVLRVERVPQPQPPITPGGDCYACASLAALRHLAPGSSETLEGMIARYKAAGDGKEPWNDWGGHLAVWRALSAEYGLPAPMPQRIQPDYRPNRPTPWYRGSLGTWWKTLQGHIDAGAVLQMPIQFDAASAIGQRDTDHCVVVDGWRERWVPVEGTQGRRQEREVHVVCSARGDYWLSIETLVWEHGASAWIALLALPEQETPA